MSADIGLADRTKVTEAMRAVLVRNALRHRADDPFHYIDPFSGALLEESGVVAVTDTMPGPDNILAALLDQSHAIRLPAPLGPLLFIRSEKQETVLDPADLLADRRPEIRIAALRFFEGLPVGILAKRTRQLLEESRTNIASDDRAQWFAAAKGIYDLLQNDMYLTLAGFGQTYALSYDLGVQRYLPRLLRPDATLLSSVELAVWNPTEEFEAVASTVRGLASADTLGEAATAYYRDFGHVPLTGEAGLGTVVRTWAEKNHESDVWTLLWAWADNCPTPVPRYHVCSAFLANPKLVPPGSEGILWAELAEIASTEPEPLAQFRWTEAWLLRGELAQHFGNFLECLIPSLPSERLMVMAWWLTERFCELFPSSPGLLKKVREITVSPELERSSFMTHLTHPQVGPSDLRYMTRIVQDTWAGSILCELASAGWLLERATPPDEMRPQVASALVRVLVQGYPKAVPGSERPVYAFERSVEPFATAWAKSPAEGNGEESAAVVPLLEQAKVLFAGESLSNIIVTLASNAHGVHLPCGVALRQYAYTQPDGGPRIWELLHEHFHWQAILRQSDENALKLVFEALTELQVQHGDPWRVSLPHMFASAAEEADDKERRHLLFGLTLFSSLHAGAVSAIDRLMHSQCRGEFAVFADRWHEKLKATLRICTPWAASRIRALLSNLSLDDLPGSQNE